MDNRPLPQFPTCSFSAAIWRSDMAMSGRRSSSVEGNATGTCGGWLLIGWGAIDNSAGGFADQDRDGVLVLRARHSEVDQLFLGRIQLRFRLRHIGAGCDT